MPPNPVGFWGLVLMVMLGLCSCGHMLAIILIDCEEEVTSAGTLESFVDISHGMLGFLHLVSEILHSGTNKWNTFNTRVYFNQLKRWQSCGWSCWVCLINLELRLEVPTTNKSALPDTRH